VAKGRRIAVVVSATAGTTDGLLDRARGLSRTPGAGLLATLLRTGEEASVALMGLALTEASVDAHVLAADELGLCTVGPLDDGEPVEVDIPRLVSCLRAHAVVVVPGFVGRTERGQPSTLGRGGSDLTALFLGWRLGATEVRLVKDVPGVLPADPRVAGPDQLPLPAASWEEVERIGRGVVQTKALRFASSAGVEFRVCGLGTEGTLVGRAIVPGRPGVRP
jgi:aspartate kinase